MTDNYEGAGQSNIFSGKACKTKLCMVIKKLESKGLEIYLQNLNIL